MEAAPTSITDKTRSIMTSNTMRAAVQTGYGRPEDVLELATIERPAIGPDDVLVRTAATSVNTPDWATVTGEPKVLRLQAGLRRPRARVRGSDVAGVVEAIGTNVTDLAVGDEVFGSAWETGKNRAGTFAESAVAPSSQLLPKPATIPFVEAAAAVMSGITALVAMRDVAEVGAGTSVLINGASGGVGTFAVQIARSLGAEVTAVCSGRNADLVRSLGAASVIDYTQDDYTKRPDRYDVILDNVLNHAPSASASVLSAGGIFLPNSLGNTGGWFAGLPRMARAALIGLGSTNVGFVRCEVNRENLASLASLIESGEVMVVIDDVYSLEDAAGAVAHMLSHRARGKVAIAV